MRPDPGRPSPEALKQMTPSDIGRRLLPFLTQFPRGFVLAELARTFGESYPQQERDEMALLNMEGLSWLVRQGLLVQDPAQMLSGSLWYQLSREGRSYVAASRAPASIVLDSSTRQLLHPRILLVATPLYERGPDSYSEAIASAFTHVETATREHIRARRGTPTQRVGAALYAEAFAPSNGALLPPGFDKGEAEGLRQFFAGSFGALRSPHAHGFIRVDDDDAVARLLLIASEQLFVLERLAEMSGTARMRGGQTVAVSGELM